MNNRWRRRFYLDEKRKIKGDVKEEIFLTRKFYYRWCNPPMPSFRKGAKHYATKR